MRKPKIQPVPLPLCVDAGVTLDMLRLDSIDPLISGNKWFKLRDHLRAAQQEGAESVLSFGGAFSNHLHALAAAAQVQGLGSIAIVRGERPLNDADLSPTLADCEAMGMQLHFVSRSEYRLRNETVYQQGLSARFNGAYLVPEGGGGALGLSGAAGIAEYFDAAKYDLIACACGTGTTLAGLAMALAEAPGKTILGVSALKDKGSIARAVSVLLQGKPAAGWRIDSRFHCGGFARINAELVALMGQYRDDFDIALEPVYTAKLMLALQHMIGSGDVAAGTRVLAIHTGGLQGLRGLQESMQRFGWPLAEGES